MSGTGHHSTSGGMLFRIGYYLYSNTSLGYHYFQNQMLTALENQGGHPHSKSTLYIHGNLKIIPLPVAEDNYSYLVIDISTHTGVVIDPSYYELTKMAVEEYNVTLLAVFNTHKHWDHCAANHHLKKHFPDLRIYANAQEKVPNLTNAVIDGDVIHIENSNLKFTVYHSPGHTIGHSVFVLDGSPYQTPDHLFCGDVLFVGGCGKIFEGNAETMLESLDMICEMGDETLMWPGHEYAVSNLKIALLIDKDNALLKDKLAWAEEKRSKHLGAIPTTIGEEKLYNPYLRTGCPEIMKALKVDPDRYSTQCRLRAHVLSEIRVQRDTLAEEAAANPSNL